MITLEPQPLRRPTTSDLPRPAEAAPPCSGLLLPPPLLRPLTDGSLLHLRQAPPATLNLPDLQATAVLETVETEAPVPHPLKEAFVQQEGGEAGAFSMKRTRQRLS